MHISRCQSCVQSMSLYIDMKMIQSLNCSSPILFSVIFFWISRSTPIFFWNSTGSPSIPFIHEIQENS